MRKLEKKLSRKLESLKRSLLYDFQRRFENVQNSISAANEVFGMNCTNNKQILGITQLPFQSIETFSEFDESLKNNFEKERAMVCVLLNVILNYYI